MAVLLSCHQRLFRSSAETKNARKGALLIHKQDHAESSMIGELQPADRPLSTDLLAT